MTTTYDYVEIKIKESLSYEDFEIYERECNMIARLNRSNLAIKRKFKKYLELIDCPLPKNSESVCELNELHRELKTILKVK